MKIPYLANTALITSVAALLLSTPMALAGPPDHHGFQHPPGAEQRLARLDQRLDLNDAQAAELLQVLQQAEAVHEDLRERVMEQMKPELCAHLDEVRQEIRSILTKEQADLFEQMHERSRNRSGLGHKRSRQLPDCAEFTDTE